MLEFTVSPALVESACSNIAAWGPPQIGIKELPFLGEILEVHMFVCNFGHVCSSSGVVQLIIPYRPPHNCFPLQGLMSRTSSKADLRVEYKEIHTSEPTGSWSRLAHLLTSLSELYIIFERVRNPPITSAVGRKSDDLGLTQALLSEPLVILADDPACASEFVSSIVSETIVVSI